MSRIDEALKRAGLNKIKYGRFQTTSPTALDQFPQDAAAVRDEVCVIDITETAPVRDAVRVIELPEPVPVRNEVSVLDIMDITPAPAETPPPERVHVPPNRDSSTLTAGGLQTDERMVICPEIRPDSLEAYLKLAALLHQAQASSRLTTLVVASAVPGDGKTLTAANIALTLSESFLRRVLLIDADLRRPTLHKLFKARNRSGLCDALKGGRDCKLSLTRISPRLMLLPAGKPERDPIAGLTSERLRGILDEARSLYDWIILDTPPVGLLPDAKVMAAMVDTVIMVVRADKTPFAAVQRAVDALGRDHVFGIVLNQAREGVAASREGYYASYRHHRRVEHRVGERG